MRGLLEVAVIVAVIGGGRALARIGRGRVRAHGRIQVVAAGVTETQGAFMTAREARRLAVAGTVSMLPAGMPGARAVTGGARARACWP